MQCSDLRRGIRRTIVHQDYLVVRIVQPLQRLETGFERAIAIIAGDDNRDLWSSLQRKIWRGAKHLLHEPVRRLGLARASGEAQLPVFDLSAVFEPLVSEAKHDPAGQAGGE